MAPRLPSAVLFCAALIASARAQDDAALFARDVGDFVAAHCLECHGAPAKGGLDLRTWSSAATAQADLDTLALVRRRLADDEMPPPERARPEPSSRAAALAWIDAALRASDVVDPGRVSLRRLTRLEYRNSVRDLFGVLVDVEGRLPVDGVGAGFDTLGDLHTLSPLLFEKYVDLAEEIAAAAVPQTSAIEISRAAGELEGGDDVDLGGRGARALYSEGAFALGAELPREGRYRLTLCGSGDQAGGEPPRLEVELGARALGAVAFAAARPDPQEQSFEVVLAAGPARLTATFANDYYQPENVDPAQRDRNVYLASWRIEGPLDPPPRSAFQQRCVDLEGGGARPLPEIVRRFLERAWRRPVAAPDLERVLALVPAKAELADALRVAIVAALISPRFLYRFEWQLAPDAARAVKRLDGYELATRLAYFLWSSTPDEQLFEAAARGELASEAGLLRETRRLLMDPRANALVEGFASQWLQLARLDDAAPDADLFPQFDRALARSMRLETQLYFEALLREDRPLMELVSAGFTFVDERLARHYGIDGVEGAHFRRVALGDARRGGVLAQAAILTLTSNPARTSPVKRGKWILEVLLDAPPAPPPPGAGALAEDAESAALPLRERLERHRRDPSCASCHARMDALGFALEAYGPIGERRTRDGAGAIDAAGELPDGRRIVDLAGLRAVLLEGRSLERAALKALLVYALGRELGAHDEPLIARAQAALAVRESRGEPVTLRGLIEAIVASAAFRQRRGEAG